MSTPDQAIGERTLRVRPVLRLAGEVRVPGDKSISHRYLMLGGIARGQTRVRGLSPGADVASTRSCLTTLGVNFGKTTSEVVSIDGRGWGGLREPVERLDAGNSGTTLRLLTGLLAGRPFTSQLSGDASLRSRPMRRVISPLVAMGARIESQDGQAPLVIHGGSLRGIGWQPEVASAQIKSAVMLAALSATGLTTIDEPAPTRYHTERAFAIFGLEMSAAGTRISVPGDQEAVAPGDDLIVPGDPSSAAVWAAGAAALPGSDVTLNGVLLNPRRLGFLRALRQLGARIDIEETGHAGGELVGRIHVRHGGQGRLVITASAVPDTIDELPVLAACAALGGELRVEGAGELRVKESDRITTLVTGLRALGVVAEELSDGFVVRGSRRPTGGVVDAAGDHRMVMAFALVGLGATGDTHVRGADAVAISYPAFERDLALLIE
jgi:3-phosphoshikimate 1-carboxyvinyltransferase